MLPLLPLIIWLSVLLTGSFGKNDFTALKCSNCIEKCPILPHSCSYRVIDECNCCEICIVQGNENCANDGYVCMNDRYCNMVNFVIKSGYCINETLDVEAFKKAFNNLDSYGTDFFEALSIGSDIVGVVSPEAGAVSNLITKAVKTTIAPDTQEYKALTNIHFFLVKFYESINKKIDRRSESESLRNMEEQYQKEISIKVAIIENVFKGIAAQKHIVSNETFHKYCTNLLEYPPALIQYIKEEFVTNCPLDEINTKNQNYRDFLTIFIDFEKNLPQKFRNLKEYVAIKQELIATTNATEMSQILLSLENIAYDSGPISNCFTEVIIETLHFERQKIFNSLYSVYEDLIELLLSTCLCADETADSNPAIRQNIIDAAVGEVKTIARHIAKYDASWSDGTMKALIDGKLNNFDLEHPENWNNHAGELQSYLNSIGSFDYKYQVLITEKFEILLQRFTHGNTEFYMEIFNVNHADIYISRFKTGLKDHARRVKKWFDKNSGKILQVLDENYGSANLSAVMQIIEEKVHIPLTSVFHTAIILHKQRVFADEAQIKFSFADSYIRGYPAMSFSDHFHNGGVADKHKVFWCL
uniref:IGFBP N-terminal domain-containing protein n=1 Tax=Panagrolaimus sp. ES5 TaxID=591445 RepID=A0AC34F261_9BILA